MAENPPKGSVTLVFTDIEGSTRLWEEREDEFRLVLEQHDQVMRSVLKRLGGYEVKTEGDAFMVAFGEPEAAVRFCLMVQQLLHEHALLSDVRVRMGVHEGEPI